MIEEIETERLILKPPTLEDACSYQRNFADYEVIKHLADSIPWPYPENGARDYLENIVLPRLGDNYWAWGIFLKPDEQELIGMIELWRPERPSNRGFWLAKSHWNKGIMTEAIEPTTAFAFETLRFEKLYFDNAVGNLRSSRIKIKQGCKKIGTRPARFNDSKYKELETWVLSKKDWLANKT